MKNLGPFWQKLVIWLTGYLNIIAFVIGAGYIYTKCDDEEIKCTAKLSLITVGGFALLDMFYSFVYQILTVFGASYEALDELAIVSGIFAILKILIFISFFILDALGQLNKIKVKLREPAVKTLEADTEES